MTKPMLLAEFTRLPPTSRACPLDGLSAAIDMVAQAAPAAHRFLRYQYYAAALARHGGAVRTILVEHDGNAVIALPIVRIGPAVARVATIPGVDVPFRGFPAARDTPDAAFDALVDALGAELNALRVGPIADDDASFAALRAAASRRGWVICDRPSSMPAVCDFAGAAMGSGRSIDGAALAGNGFDALVAIDGEDGIAFWRAAAADSVLAALLSASVVENGGLPVAFALYLDADEAHHVVAHGGDIGLPETSRRPTMREWLLIRPGLPALLGRALSRLWAAPPS